MKSTITEIEKKEIKAEGTRLNSTLAKKSTINVVAIGGLCFIFYIQYSFNVGMITLRLMLHHFRLL